MNNPFNDFNNPLNDLRMEAGVDCGSGGCGQEVDPCANGGCEDPCANGGCEDPCANGGCEQNNDPCANGGCNNDPNNDPCANGGCNNDPNNDPCANGGCNNDVPAVTVDADDVSVSMDNCYEDGFDLDYTFSGASEGSMLHYYIADNSACGSSCSDPTVGDIIDGVGSVCYGSYDCVDEINHAEHVMCNLDSTSDYKLYLAT